MKTMRPMLAALLLGALLTSNLVIEAVKLIQPARAASPKRYQIVPYDQSNSESILNQYAKDGWELVVIEPKSGAFILEKE